MSSTVHPTTDDVAQPPDEQLSAAAKAQASKFADGIPNLALGKSASMKEVRSSTRISAKVVNAAKAVIHVSAKLRKRRAQRGSWVKTFPPDVGKSTLVCLERARGLASRDMLGSSDPYCVVYWWFDEVHRTAVRHNDLNPEWADEKPFELAWPTNLLGKKAAELHIEVFDRDAVGKDDQLGEVRLTVDEICSAVMAGGQTLVKPLRRAQLMGKKGKNEKDVQGTLTFWVGDHISNYKRSAVGDLDDSQGGAAKSGAAGCCVVQ